jgi:hypothetical protein
VILLGMTIRGKTRSENAMFAMKMSVVFFMFLEFMTTTRIKVLPTRAKNITRKFASVAPNLPHCVLSTASQSVVPLYADDDDVLLLNNILAERLKSSKN